MTEYNAGDLVEAVKGDTVIRGRITGCSGDWVGTSRSQIPGLVKDGFTVTVIERATPPLPTEEGIYFPRRTFSPGVRIVKLSDGAWRDPEGKPLNDASMKWLAGIHASGDLTLFEPVPVTAKRLIDRVIELDGGADGVRLSVLRISNELAAEFGVES